MTELWRTSRTALVASRRVPEVAMRLPNPHDPQGEKDYIDVRIHGTISPGHSIVIRNKAGGHQPQSSQRSPAHQSGKPNANSALGQRSSIVNLALTTILKLKKSNVDQLLTELSSFGHEVPLDTLKRYIRFYKKAGLIKEISRGIFASIDSAIVEHFEKMRR